MNNIYEERQIFLPARFYAGVIKARKDEVEFVERLVDFLRSKLVEFAYEQGLISQRVIPLLIILKFLHSKWPRPVRTRLGRRLKGYL